MNEKANRRVSSRREFLRLAGFAAGTAAVAACAAPAAPPPQIVKETVEVPVQQTVEVPVQQTVEVQVEKVVTPTTSPSALNLSKEVTLSMAFYGTPIWMRYGDGVKAAFEKRYPNVTLSIEYWAGDDQAFLDSITARLVAGNPPDVGFAGGFSWVDAFKGKGGLLDLRPFWDLLPKEDQDDFYPGPLQMYFGKANELWGLPMLVFSETVGVWKPAFEEAGIPLPPDDWTWDDLVAMAPKLTKKDDSGKVTRWGYRLNAFDLSHLAIPVWAYGGELFNADYTKFMGDAPEALAGMQVIYDLIWKYGASPSATTILEQQNDSYNAFSAGQTALWMQGSWFYGNVRSKLASADEKTRNAWDILRPPMGPKGRCSFVSANPIYAFKATKEPEWSWEVIRQVTSTESQSLAATLMGCEVGRKSANVVAKDPTQAPEHGERTGQQMAECSRPAPQPPHYNEVYDIFNRLLQESFWENKVPLEQALADVKQKVDALLLQPE